MANEIEKKSVTMEVFRNRMKDNPLLEEVDLRNASDRVRSEWGIERKFNCKHEEEEDGTPPSEPPIQKDTISENKNLIFSSSTSSCSSDVLAPSNSSFVIRNIFDEDKFSSKGMSEYGEWKCHFANRC